MSVTTEILLERCDHISVRDALNDAFLLGFNVDRLDAKASLIWVVDSVCCAMVMPIEYRDLEPYHFSLELLFGSQPYMGSNSPNYVEKRDKLLLVFDAIVNYTTLSALVYWNSGLELARRECGQAPVYSQNRYNQQWWPTPEPT